MQAFKRISTPKLFRQSVRNGGGGPHKTRSQAFFPKFVNYANAEDQVILTLSFFLSFFFLSFSLLILIILGYACSTYWLGFTCIFC